MAYVVIKLFTLEINEELLIFKFNLLSSFACSECGKWFGSGITLHRHKMWHHLSSVSYRYKCNNCPYGTNKKTNFDTHSYVHRPDRTHWCSFCGNGFTTASSLNKHVIIHTGEDNRALFSVHQH